MSIGKFIYNMAFPEVKTVGEVIDFLQKAINEGKIQRGTKVFNELYCLTPEDSILKKHEDELDYHVPDDMHDEVLNIRLGYWSGDADPTSESAAYVALSTYMTHNQLERIARDKLSHQAKKEIESNKLL